MIRPNRPKQKNRPAHRQRLTGGVSAKASTAVNYSAAVRQQPL